METRADLKPKLPNPLRDDLGASDRSRWPVEGGKEAIPSGVALFTPEPRQLAPHESVMTVQHLPPTPVAQFGRAFGRANDVRKEKRRENRLRHLRRLFPGDEPLHLLRALGR